VTFRFLRLLALQLLLVLSCGLAAAADNVEITSARIDATEDGYRLYAAYSFDLTHGMEDAIQHGVPLAFTTDVQVIKPRWYWRDEVVVDTRRTVRIFYDVLTRFYHVSYLGTGLSQRFNTLEDALFTIRRTTMIIAPRGALKPGENYTVTLKMGIDRELLSKPFQVNAFNNAEWRLNSNTKKFIYRAE